MAIKRGIALGDFHNKYVDWKLVKLYKKFIKDFKPNEIIYLGDFLNLSGYATHHGKRKDEAPITKVGDDFKSGERVLDELEYGCDQIFIFGNHEKHQEEYFTENPDQFDESMLIENRLQLKKRGFKKIIPYNDKRNRPQFYKSGKLHFLHGWRAGIYAVRQHLIQDYHTNFVMGHIHKSDIATSSNIEGKPIQGYSIGCSCQLDWNYSQSKHTNHGFGVYYILPNGNFNFYNIIIYDYKFIFEGEIYQS